jgi:hypothetical protein
MDGWTLAIFALAAFVALRSLVVLMRAYRNNLAAGLPRRSKQPARTAPAQPPPPAPTSPTEATSANGESTS